jgi:Family of unknown function (UPF0738)
MSEKLVIHRVSVNNQKEIQMEVDQQISLNQYRASGQMLVDSDGLSFVYLLEKEEDYTYIVIPNTVWKELKIALTEQLPVYLSKQSERLLLNQFHEELSYLIENIKGNSNYGEKMVNEVEAIFE